MHSCPMDLNSIAHTTRGQGTVMAIPAVSDAKLATSGTYEGFRTILST